MSLTRAQVETELIERLGNWLTQAGKDGTTNTGTNAALNGPIAFAVRQLGYTVLDLSDVTSSDLASVLDTQTDELFDVAELRTLKNILGNLDQVDIKMGPISKSLSQLRASVEKRIASLSADIQATYTTGMPEATVEDAPFYQPTGDIWALGAW